MVELTVSAQLSIYPLRQEHLTPAIEAVTAALDAHGLQAKVGPMSTQTTGDANAIFAALKEGFAAAAAAGPVVMTITLSNACPVPQGDR